MINLLNGDNNSLLKTIFNYYQVTPEVIYADCIYESLDFNWAFACYDLLKNDGIFYIQTDYHSVAEWKIFLDKLYGKNNFINWLIYKQEWGGSSRKCFPKKHDDILMYSKGKDYKFYPDRIQIPKVTANTNLDKKGTGLKTPCDVFDDLGNFSTISKERLKVGGKNIRWQKSLKLMNRLLYPVSDENDLIIDPFMGSGTTGVWCKLNNRNFIGIENNIEVFELAKDRIEKA